MTKLKKAICLFVCAVISAAFVTGCAIFEDDVDYYNNLVVASIGANIKITKLQLMSAYNSYGYQYVSQQGLSVEKAYEKTLEDLIDREILVELSIQNFSSHLSAEDIKGLRGKKGMDSLFYHALYENEKAEVRKQAFDAVNQYYKQLQDNVREERKQSSDSSGAEDPNQKTPAAVADSFKPFESLVDRKSSNSVFSMNTSGYESKELFCDKVPDIWSADIDDDGISTDKSVKVEALGRLVRLLKNNEKGMKVGTAEKELVRFVPSGKAGFLNDSDRAIIGRELGRMIEDYSKTFLTRRYQDIFEFGIGAPIDRSLYGNDDEAYLKAVRAAAAERYGGHVVDCEDSACKGCKDARAYELAERARAYYRTQVLSQHNRFVKGMDTVSALEGKVTESLSDLYWLPQSVAENSFTVSHILIQYTEEQKAEFESLKSELATGGSVTSESYVSRLKTLQESLKAPMRDEKGSEVLDKNDEVISKSATEILKDIEKAVNGKTEQERINIFRDYIYRYNQDPGMMNAEFEYVLGIIKGPNGTISPNSKMVEEFTKASLELFGYKQNKYNENNVDVLKWEKVNGFKPKPGSMTSELVMTDFGAHIIMYTRTLSDFICSAVPNSSYFEYDFLYAPLNSYGDYFGITFDLAGKQVIPAPAKTVFDVMVERITRPDFETLRRKKVADFKGAREGSGGKLINPIKLHKGNYKDLLK